MVHSQCRLFYRCRYSNHELTTITCNTSISEENQIYTYIKKKNSANAEVDDQTTAREGVEIDWSALPANAERAASLAADVLCDTNWLQPDQVLKQQNNMECWID